MSQQGRLPVQEPFIEEAYPISEEISCCAYNLHIIKMNITSGTGCYPAIGFLSLEQKQHLQQLLKQSDRSEMRERVLILLLMNDGRARLR